MKTVYEGFDLQDYEEEFCTYCVHHKVYEDWDEGGPEVAGGMAPTRLRVHECNYQPNKKPNCPIEAYDRQQKL